MKSLPTLLCFGLITACSPSGQSNQTASNAPTYRLAADALPQNALLGLSMDAAVADMDQDGDLDILTCNSNGPTYQELSPYRVFLNDGRGYFTLVDTGFLPEGVAGSGFDAEQADFNGDGKPDLFLASRGTTDQLLIGQ